MLDERETGRAVVEAELNDRGETIDGELIFPGGSDYDSARMVWNTRFDRRPAVIVRCAGPDDVVVALRLAERHGWPLAVRSGGHSYAGHSTCDGGVLIDLSMMKRLAVDPVRRVAVAEPGLTWGEVADAAQESGLTAIGGHVSIVGVAGLTLGGGIGWLARTHGLACDNLIEAELVTAEGTIVRASEQQNPELFWGLRGGGGNFGVVIRFTLRLHPIEPLMFAGMVMFPGERSREVLRFFRDFGEAAPDAVNVMAGLVTAPPEPFVPADMQGRPAVMLAACYVGPPDDGARALAPLRELAPAVDLLAPMPFSQLQHLFDAMSASRVSFLMKSELLGPLDDAALDALAEQTADMPSPFSNVLLIPLGGAVRDVAPEDSAFTHRDASYNIEIGGVWLSTEEDAEPYHRWVEACWQAMRPWSSGVEVNHLGDEGSDRVREAYGEQAYARLAALKRAWDPNNVFRLNQNIEPAR